MARAAPKFSFSYWEGYTIQSVWHAWKNSKAEFPFRRERLCRARELRGRSFKDGVLYHRPHFTEQSVPVVGSTRNGKSSGSMFFSPFIPSEKRYEDARFNVRSVQPAIRFWHFELLLKNRDVVTTAGSVVVV